MIDTTNPPEVPRLPAHEQSRYGAAAEYALRRYPGPVGELIHRELLAYARFGRRFATDALIPHLMKHVLSAAPSPGDATGGTAPSGVGTAANGAFLAVPGPVLWPRPGHRGRSAAADG